MQICKDHWRDVREAITERGLDGLVSKDGKAAFDAMERQLRGQDDKRDFDPLMNANWAICSAYLRDVGLAGMVGDKCPLCEVEKSKPGLAANWIAGCATDQLEQARELGLVPVAS